MSEQDLTLTVQELMAEISAMRAELTELKGRANALPKAEPQPVEKAKAIVSTTRRKLLKRLAGGILAGLAVTGITASLPGQAEAKFVASGGAGAVVMPTGGTVTGNLPVGTVFGLYATTDASVDLGDFQNGISVKAGVFGNATTSGANVYGVIGHGGNYGVYGNGDYYGVYGEGYVGVYGSGSNYGVQAYSSGGTALNVTTSSGVPLHISPGSQPAMPASTKGDIYIDTDGDMYIFNGSVWKKVTTT
jgi:hypothetical protein